MNTILKNIPQRVFQHIGVLLFADLLMVSGIVIVSDMASFCFLFLLPGYLMMRTLGVERTGFWQTLVHFIALSIAFVLFGGLLSNALQPLFGIMHPLGFEKVLATFNALLVCLICAEGVVNKQSPPLALPAINLKAVAPHAILAILPALSIAGATILNNGGTNTLTLILLAGIVIYLLWLCIEKKDASEELLMSSLYFISLALLLMVSMRSWCVVGYDVSHELQVFKLTQGDLYWTMAHLQDAYNACLSITLLPTIVSQFMHIGNEYIFKFLFQVLFALMPVGIYALIRNYADKWVAFLSAIFFIGQTNFFQSMQSLIRQEFGLIFFTVLLFALFTKNQKSRYWLACLYGAGMIVSHYSTSYIAILLFITTFVISVDSSFLRRIFAKEHGTPVEKRAVSFPFIVFLIAALLGWNALFTRTFDNFTGFLEKTSSNVEQVFTSTAFIHALNSVMYKHQANDLAVYVDATTAHYHTDAGSFNFYDKQITDRYPIVPELFPTTPPHIGAGSKSFALGLFTVLKILANDVLISIGVGMVFYWWARKKFQESEFLFMAVAGFVLLDLLLVMPQALESYNLERLYIQLLVVWSFFGVFAGVKLLQYARLGKYMRVILVSLFSLLLLFYSGFIFVFTGGPASINLNNFGQDYEKDYVHESEIAAAAWLSARDNSMVIYASIPGVNRLAAFGNIDKTHIAYDTLPSAINKHSYVYLAHMNVVGERGLAIFHNEEQLYSYPNRFLDDNKDLVYNTDDALIYR